MTSKLKKKANEKGEGETRSNRNRKNKVESIKAGKVKKREIPKITYMEGIITIPDITEVFYSGFYVSGYVIL